MLGCWPLVFPLLHASDECVYVLLNVLQLRERTCGDDFWARHSERRDSSNLKLLRRPTALLRHLRPTPEVATSNGGGGTGLRSSEPNVTVGSPVSSTGATISPSSLAGFQAGGAPDQAPDPPL